MDKEMEILTYSALSKFRNCRRAYKRRYIDKLVTKDKAAALSVGAYVHGFLEIWYKKEYLRAIKGAKCLNEQQVALVRAMMQGYKARYPTEGFEVIAVEKTFECPIINPATGQPSRSYKMSGKVDGIIKLQDEYYLMEHKTASSLANNYLDKLWTDFQSILYSHYLSQAMGIEISGVLYNVLIKAKLKQGEGETEEEHQERYKDLCAKNKSGKSSAERKMPETNEEYLNRLIEKYKDPAMFHREMLYFTKGQLEEIQAEVWELTQALLDAKRRGIYYCNSSCCFNYNRPCSYYPLCTSNDSPAILAGYDIEEPHQELKEDSPF